jgi:hypothetical protein
MSASFATSPLLRLALTLDGIASCTGGLALLAGVSALAGLLGLPPSLMIGAGLFTLVYGVAVAWLGRQPSLKPAWVWPIIVGNFCWAAASLAILGLGLVQPTVPGMVLIVAQAAMVAVFAELQLIGLRRSPAESPIAAA